MLIKLLSWEVVLEDTKYLGGCYETVNKSWSSMTPLDKAIALTV